MPLTERDQQIMKHGPQHWDKRGPSDALRVASTLLVDIAKVESIVLGVEVTPLPLVQYRTMTLIADAIEAAWDSGHAAGHAAAFAEATGTSDTRPVTSAEFARAEADWQKAYEDRVTPYAPEMLMPDSILVDGNLPPGTIIYHHGEPYEVQAGGTRAFRGIPARSDAKDILRTQADKTSEEILREGAQQFSSAMTSLATGPEVRPGGASAADAVDQYSRFNEAAAAAVIDKYLGEPLGATPPEAAGGDLPVPPAQATRPKGGRPKGAKDRKKRKARKDKPGKAAAKDKSDGPVLTETVERAQTNGAAEHVPADPDPGIIQEPHPEQIAKLFEGPLEEEEA